MPIALELPDGAPPTIPVVTIEDAAAGPGLARALLAGGVRAMEVTLRSAAALDAMAAIGREVPEMLVGAGTVLSAEDMARSKAAGAGFLVSPGGTQALLDAAETIGLPYLPGVATVSEAMALREMGYRRLKFFPADAVGGKVALTAFYGPLPDLEFCPTGGVGAANAAEFLELGNVFAVGGSWLAPPDAIASRDWGRIEALAREAARLV